MNLMNMKPTDGFRMKRHWSVPKIMEIGSGILRCKQKIWAFICGGLELFGPFSKYFWTHSLLDVWVTFCHFSELKKSKYYFLENLTGWICWHFMKRTLLLWCHLYFEHSLSVQYFAYQLSFATHQALNCIVGYEKNEQVEQKEVEQYCFYCSTCCQNSVTY